MYIYIDKRAFTKKNRNDCENIKTFYKVVYKELTPVIKELIN